MSVTVNPNTNKVYVAYSDNRELSIINGTIDTPLDEDKNIAVGHPCPIDIAVNLEKNHSYVSYNCFDGIFLINEDDTSPSHRR